MSRHTQVIIFRIDGQSYAIPLSDVDRVIRAVEVTPLPKAPETVLGIIDYHGTLVPVLSLRKRLSLDFRDISTNDRFVIARTSRRTIVLTVDEVTGLSELTWKR